MSTHQIANEIDAAPMTGSATHDEEDTPMTKTTTTLALAAVALAATTGLASAHSTKEIDRAQSAQFEKIDQARTRGELTKREYRDLLDEQNRIAELERQAKADGRVTKREVRALRESQLEARQNIAEESSDRQKSWLRRFLYKTR